MPPPRISFRSPNSAHVIQLHNVQQEQSGSSVDSPDALTARLRAALGVGGTRRKQTLVLAPPMETMTSEKVGVGGSVSASRIIGAGESVSALLASHPLAVLELWNDPVETPIRRKGHEEVRVLLDFAADLTKSHRTLARVWPDLEYGRYTLSPQGKTRPLAATSSPAEQGVGRGAPLLLLTATDVAESPMDLFASCPATAKGTMSMQIREVGATAMSSRVEYEAELHGTALCLFQRRGTPSPDLVLFVDAFVALRIAPKGKPALVLRRAEPDFGGTVDFYLFSGTESVLDAFAAAVAPLTASTCKVFGVPLTKVLERQRHRPPVPALVEAVANWLEELDSTSVATLTTPTAQLTSPARALVSFCRDRYDRAESVDWPALASSASEVVAQPAAAALLRDYLSELPEPLVPSDLTETVATAVADGSEAALCEAIARLDLDSFILLKYLASLLARIVARDPSQLDAGAQRIAETFAPVFSRSADPMLVRALLSRHKRLYTLRDGKKMRLEFKAKKAGTSSNRSTPTPLTTDQPGTASMVPKVAVPPPRDGAAEQPASLLSPRSVAAAGDASAAPTSSAAARAAAARVSMIRSDASLESTTQQLVKEVKLLVRLANPSTPEVACTVSFLHRNCRSWARRRGLRCDQESLDECVAYLALEPHRDTHDKLVFIKRVLGYVN